MRAPSRKPAPQLQPRAATAATVPAAAIQTMLRPMRAAARPKSSASAEGSGGIACIFHDLPDELDESAYASQNDSRHVDPMRPEEAVEPVAEQIPHESGRGQQQRQGAVFGE